MSLNRYEQTLLTYIEHHPEEGRFWRQKLQELVGERAGDTLGAAGDLERALWEYYVERSQQVAALRDLNTGGLRRVSLRNLADYLLRVWGPPPKPKRPALPGREGMGGRF